MDFNKIKQKYSTETKVKTTVDFNKLKEKYSKDIKTTNFDFNKIKQKYSTDITTPKTDTMQDTYDIGVGAETAMQLGKIFSPLRFKSELKKSDMDLELYESLTPEEREIAGVKKPLVTSGDIEKVEAVASQRPGILPIKPLAKVTGFEALTKSEAQKAEIYGSLTPEEKESIKIEEPLADKSTYETINKALDYKLNPKQITYLAGNIGKYMLARQLFGGLLEDKIANPIIARASITNPFAKKMITETAIEAPITAYTAITEGIGEGLKGKDLVKRVGQEALIDFAANLMFEGIGSGLKLNVDDTIQIISKELDIPTGELDDVGVALAKQVELQGTGKVKTKPKKTLEEVIEKSDKRFNRYKKFKADADTFKSQLDEVKSRDIPSVALRKQPDFVKGQFVDYQGKQYEITDIVDDVYKGVDSYGQEIDIPVSKPLKEVDVDKQIKDLENLMQQENLTIANKIDIEKQLDELDNLVNIEKMPKHLVAKTKKLNQAYDKIADLEAKYRVRMNDTQEAINLKTKLRVAEQKAKIEERAFRKQVFDNIKKASKTVYKDANDKKIKGLIGNIDTKAQSMSSSKKLELNGIKNYVSSLKEQGLGYNEELIDMTLRLNKTQQKDISLEDLSEINRTIEHINFIEKNKRNIITQRESRAVDTILEATKKNLPKEPEYKIKTGLEKKVEKASGFRKNLKSATTNNESVMYELAQADKNHPIYKYIHEPMKRAHAKLAGLKYEASKFLDTLGLVDNKKEIINIGGQEREISTLQKMSMYLMEKSADGKNALNRIHFDEDDLLGVELDDLQVRALIDSLTADEKQRADIIFKYLNTTAKDNVNTVSEAIEGVPRAVQDNYFTIVRYGKGKDSAWNSFKRSPSLSNAGQLKPRTGSDDGILLLGIDDIFKNYTDAVNKYVAFEQPIRNVEMVFRDKELQRQLKLQFGDKFYDSFKQGIEEIKGVYKPQSAPSEFISKIIKNVQSSILYTNLSVLAKQIPSIFTAMAKIDPKYFVNNIKVPDKFTMYQYAPILWERVQEGFTRASAEALDKKLGRAFSANIRFGDTLAMKNIWKAASAEAIDKGLKEGTEEFYQAVGKRVTDVVFDTQPNFSPYFRPPALRDENPLVRLWTMFSTQRSQNANLIKQGIIKAKYTGDYSELVRNTSAVLAGSLTIAGLSTGFQVARGQEATPVKNAIGSVASNAVLVGPIINKLLYGFDVDNVSEGAINEFIDSVIRLANTKDEKDIAKNVYNLAETISTLSGVPLKTARKNLEMLMNLTGIEY